MQLSDRRTLKNSADDSLKNALYDPRKIIMIHAGASIAITLVGGLIQVLIGQKISGTSGLAGLGSRSVLATLQSLLQFIVVFVAPFWEAGFLYYTIQVSRGQSAPPDTLLEGFRRFGPILRCTLLRLVVYLVIGFVSFTFSMNLFVVTPLSDPLYELLQNVDMTSSVLMTDPALQQAITRASLPLLLISGFICISGILYVSYHLRMAEYLVLDRPGTGAWMAMMTSRFQMRGHKLEMFKLDLSFAWFYILMTLFSVLAYGDYILAILGITLPFSPMGSYILFLILSLACQGILFVLAKNKIGVTYAKAYEITLAELEQQAGPLFKREQN